MSALFKISYGLYVLSARQGDKHSGCIINTAMQVSVEPEQVCVFVAKANYTHDLIKETGKFNVSMLTEKADFQLFKHFGFRSGRDVEKFDGTYQAELSENGLYYLTESTNSFISVEVTQTVDLGSHTQFIGNITEEKVMNNDPSVTYQYYFDHIKPAPQTTEKKKGFVCRICGYIYEGDVLPPDYICPLCKHGAEDFEPLQ